MDNNTSNTIQTETATLGNGCFWCTEAIFQQVKGVISVTSGYCGGETANPDYKSVCSGTTGHAECLQVVFDPAVISFASLLEIFWKTHDPTTLNRQGNDIGTQYRSVVFFHNDEQKLLAEKYIEQLNASGTFSKPIVTTLEPFTQFYPAEGYHQNYYKLNGNAPYCQFVVRPKVEKFVKSYADRIK
jgi:peptide-methionine (S)-S-oxide reductase